jgi:protein-disulfide isomerase
MDSIDIGGASGMNNRFVIILVVIVLGFFGLLFFTKKDNTVQPGQPSNHTYGEGKSGVLLVEYADFQCPACLRFYPVLQEVKEKYKEQVTFQFKHLPLVEIHQNALISSRAAEAASNQNNFWEMHDKLYENQTDWAESTEPNKFFEQYAKELGLDVEKFKADLAGEETNRTVQADLKEAKDQGFNSTPTFVLDGKKLEDVEPTVEYFSKKLDEAIKSKKSGQQ